MKVCLVFVRPEVGVVCVYKVECLFSESLLRRE